MAAIAGAVSMCACTPRAFAFTLGDAEVRSALGQPLRLRVPYQTAPGEIFDASCVRVQRLPIMPSDIPSIVSAQPTLISQGGRTYIALESPRSVNDPAARLVVDVNCGAISSRREFVLLFDPPERLAAHTPPATAQAPVAAPLRSADASKTRPVPAAPRTRDAGVARTAPAARAPARQTAQAPTGVQQPVLRIDPPAAGLGASGGGEPVCCLRLSYELTDPTASSLSPQERERWREEMRARTEEDPVARLQAADGELAALKTQLTAANRELEDMRTRAAQEAQATRDYVLYAVYAAVAAALVLALWQWLAMKRRRAATVPEAPPASATASAAARPEPEDLISILGPDVSAAVPARATPAESGALSLDLDLTADTSTATDAGRQSAAKSKPLDFSRTMEYRKPLL